MCLLRRRRRLATTLTVENIIYADAQKIIDTLKGNSNISTINQTFGSNKAVISVRHTGTTEDLLSFITKTRYGKITEIVQFENGKISLKMK